MRPSLPLRAFLLAAAILLAACASSPGKGEATVVAPYAELKLAELEALAGKEPSRVLESALALLDEGSAALPPIPRPALEALVGSATASLARRHAEARSGGDPRAALAALRSLRALAGARPALLPLLGPEAGALAASGPGAEAELLAEDAASFAERGIVSAGLLVYLEALAIRGERPGGAGPELPPPGGDEALATWAARALAARDRPALAILARALEARKLEAPPGSRAFLESRDSIADMKKGVVTIRVDRGIRIEQGYGVPDRVLGSGFFVDAGGYLLTNYHVIESEVDPSYDGYSRLSVISADSPELRIPARVLGWDRFLDLALLKAETSPGYVFSLSASELPDPGERILAIGSPAGLESTVTQGIVSAVGRRILPLGDALQVDAPLNPGNSGGPLLDESGEVAGIVFAGLPQFQGLSFAIPAAWAARSLPGMARGGAAERAWLGFAAADLGSRPAGMPRLELSYRHPAAGPGLEPGDELVSLLGREASSIPALQAALMTRSPGELVAVELRRDGRSLDRLRVLGLRPWLPLESAARLDLHEKLFPALLGMRVRRIPGGILTAEVYTVEEVYPGGIADESGLSESDPFALRRFVVDEKAGAILVQIQVKKRKAGFLESVLLLPAPLDIPDFL